MWIEKLTKEYEEQRVVGVFNRLFFDLFYCFILTFEPIEYCSRSVSIIVLEQIALNLLHKCFSSGRTCKSILKLYRKYSHSLSLPLYLSLSFLFCFPCVCFAYFVVVVESCNQLPNLCATLVTHTTCWTWDKSIAFSLSLWLQRKETSASAHNLLITLLRPPQWEKKTKKKQKKRKSDWNLWKL